MKTVRRHTATLLSLLALYLLGYWFLIKNQWADKLLNDRSVPFGQGKAMMAVYNIFQPIADLDTYWNFEIPTRKYLTGYWITDLNSEFVNIGPNQECHFRLGEFSFEGDALYDRYNDEFIMEFPYQEQLHIFRLIRFFPHDPFTPVPPSSDERKRAIVKIERTDNTLLPPKLVFEATLTKQPPSAPAP